MTKYWRGSNLSSAHSARSWGESSSAPSILLTSTGPGVDGASLLAVVVDGGGVGLDPGKTLRFLLARKPAQKIGRSQDEPLYKM